jgi:beta-1,4-mannooligosaccharide/beta-1,4-mannosyl-N-acetylglucosamine phosphorylase
VKTRIVGDALPAMPWQDRPSGYKQALWRHTGNPIIGWNPTPRCARIFNSALVPFQGGYAGVFRADHIDGKAYLHAGFSKDALHWDIEDDPIQWRDESGAPYQPFYAYDPRVVKLDDSYSIVWCVDMGGPALGLGFTRDFKSFTRRENAFIPFNRNGVLFPRKIGGNYLMLSRPSDNGHTPFGDIFLSESPDLIYWGKHRRVMTRGGSGWWQSTKIGAGPIPIETSEGWLLFYHGVITNCNGYVYSFGAALLDLQRPSKVLYRTRDYLLTPQEPYETVGFVPNVCFPCSTLADAPSGRIAVYYGAADSYTAIAYCTVDGVVDFIKEHSELCPGDAEDWRG